MRRQLQRVHRLAALARAWQQRPRAVSLVACDVASHRADTAAFGTRELRHRAGGFVCRHALPALALPTRVHAGHAHLGAALLVHGCEPTLKAFAAAANAGDLNARAHFMVAARLEPHHGSPASELARRYVVRADFKVLFEIWLEVRAVLAPFVWAEERGALALVVSPASAPLQAVRARVEHTLTAAGV
eukprot:2515762-Pleurochrysis_carterae.AAC.1